MPKKANIPNVTQIIRFSRSTSGKKGNVPHVTQIIKFSWRMYFNIRPNV